VVFYFKDGRLFGDKINDFLMFQRFVLKKRPGTSWDLAPPGPPILIPTESPDAAKTMRGGHFHIFWKFFAVAEVRSTGTAAATCKNA